MLSLVEYTEEFLELSWLWLSDPEIKELTMTPDFTKKEQLNAAVYVYKDLGGGWK